MNTPKRVLTAEEIAQWVLDNRYAQNENKKLSDRELFDGLCDKINELTTIPLSEFIKVHEALEGVMKLRDLWGIKPDYKPCPEHDGEMIALY